MSTADAREQQRALYGLPLGELCAQVMVGLGLTQGRLAEALGLSAPMLSQLMTGQRVKIGNPAVVHRLQLLLELVQDAADLSLQEVAERISAVREEQATLTGQGRPSERDAALRVLAGTAGAEHLEHAAAAVEQVGGRGAADLAVLLRDAARVAAAGG